MAAPASTSTPSFDPLPLIRQMHRICRTVDRCGGYDSEENFTRVAEVARPKFLEIQVSAWEPKDPPEGAIKYAFQQLVEQFSSKEESTSATLGETMRRVKILETYLLGFALDRKISFSNPKRVSSADEPSRGAAPLAVRRGRLLGGGSSGREVWQKPLEGGAAGPAALAQDSEEEEKERYWAEREGARNEGRGGLHTVAEMYERAFAEVFPERGKTTERGPTATRENEDDLMFKAAMRASLQGRVPGGVHDSQKAQEEAELAIAIAMSMEPNQRHPDGPA